MISSCFPFSSSRSPKETRAHYTSRFRYVLVDEFQDTSGNQYDMMRLLVGRREERLRRR